MRGVLRLRVRKLVVKSNSRHFLIPFLRGNLRRLCAFFASKIFSHHEARHSKSSPESAPQENTSLDQKSRLVVLTNVPKNHPCREMSIVPDQNNADGHASPASSEVPQVHRRRGKSSTDTSSVCRQKSRRATRRDPAAPPKQTFLKKAHDFFGTFGCQTFCTGGVEARFRVVWSQASSRTSCWTAKTLNRRGHYALSLSVKLA
ncbi:unnamed protein product [Ixodes pacificus]